MPTRLLDPTAVQAQLARLARCAAPGAALTPWLHAEVGRRMAERLAIIRAQPERIAVWSGALGGGARLLRERYPGALRWIVEPSQQLAEHSRRAEQGAWWQASRWRAPSVEVQLDSQPLPAGLGLIWANMVLHAVADPPALIGRWQQALGVDGFVMFSSLGPGSMAGLREVYRRAGWAAPGIDFVDMHDFGDMLVQAGFADPVMDQETLTLTWPTAGALLDELRGLGGNVSPHRSAGLRTPRWKAELQQALEALRGADGRLALEFEIAYGHAFKAPPRPARATRTTVSLEAMRTLVKAPRSGG